MRNFSEALALAESWTKAPFDNDTQTAVRALLQLPEGEKETAIVDRFGYDLSFGTAGMRAIMDIGTARTNEYTIARVTVAVAQVLKAAKEKPAVVIGYDGRKDSQKFARVAQLKFLEAGIDVFAFDRILPTPLIPFAVRRLKADCGVMITSSHNAAPYNGYKVYAANGAQILSPFDTDVMAAMEKIPYAGTSQGVAKPGKLTLLDETLLRDYVGWVTGEADFSPAEKRSLKIVFTPLHGAAGAMMNAAFYRAGFKNFLPVPQQYEPRPDFPTVKAPNPENKDSLDMAIAMAKEENADLILATDGDGDRVGVAYKTDRGFVSLTGNQIGTLFLYYLLAKMRERKADLSKAIALSSVVSTPSRASSAISLASAILKRSRALRIWVIRPMNSSSPTAQHAWCWPSKRHSASRSAIRATKTVSSAAFWVHILRPMAASRPGSRKCIPNAVMRQKTPSRRSSPAPKVLQR